MLNQKLLGAKSVPVDPAWNISFAKFNGEPINYFNVTAQEINPTGGFFKPDGTKMYVTGSSGDDVNEYDLGTAWDVSTASYLQNFSVSAQETIPEGLFFKPDGTKMYVVGRSGDAVNEYNLSTAWDVSTATYLQKFSVATEETDPRGLFFKPDGTKMYVVGRSGDAVYEYDLSSAWDISTATYLQNFSVSSQDTRPTDVFFKPDGTKMYVVVSFGDDVNEYDLSTAWDISTASFFQLFSVVAQATIPQDVFFKDDGTVMYIVDSNSSTFYQYQLSSAWDISTASFTLPDERFDVSAQGTNPQDMFFKPDGTKMYVIDSSDDVNEYNLSTAWDISSATYLQNFSVSTQETNPRGFFFKPDGTKMYVIGFIGDDVNEYNLSTAWDISTATYLQNFSVASQQTLPEGLFFKPDGLKMYVLGNSGNDINEYGLSNAWDVSTASFVQNFSISAQETNPQGMFFKPDGTKMYVTGWVGADVNEYNLSTAWDISTATYLQNFSVASQEVGPTGVFFKPDGTKMFIIGPLSIAVWAYDLAN